MKCLFSSFVYTNFHGCSNVYAYIYSIRPRGFIDSETIIKFDEFIQRQSEHQLVLGMEITIAKNYRKI